MRQLFKLIATILRGPALQQTS